MMSENIGLSITINDASRDIGSSSKGASSSTSNQEDKGSTKTNDILTSLGNTMKGLAVEIGVIALVVSTFSSLIEPILRMLKMFMTIVFAPLIAIVLQLIRPVMLLLMRWLMKVMNISGAAQKTAGQAVEGSSTIIDALGTGDVMGPMKGMMDSFDEIQESGGSFAKGLSVLAIAFMVPFQALIIFIRGFVDGIKIISGALKIAWDAVKKVWESIPGQLEIAWGSIKDFLNSIPDVLSTAWNAIKDVLNSVPGALTTAWNWITNGINTIWSALKTAWNWITNGLDTIWNTLKTAWGWFTSGLDTIWINLKSAWQSIIDGLKNWVSKLPLIGKHLIRSEAYGGTVSQDGLYKLHAGETVNTANNGNNTINITVNAADNSNINQIANTLSNELRRRLEW